MWSDSGHASFCNPAPSEMQPTDKMTEHPVAAAAVSQLLFCGPCSAAVWQDLPAAESSFPRRLDASSCRSRLRPSRYDGSPRLVGTSCWRTAGWQIHAPLQCRAARCVRLASSVDCVCQSRSQTGTPGRALLEHSPHLRVWMMRTLSLRCHPLLQHAADTSDFFQSYAEGGKSSACGQQWHLQARSAGKQTLIHGRRAPRLAE